MAAVRRLRGTERRHPGDLSDAQYGAAVRPRRAAASCPRASWPTLADVAPASATEMLDELEAKELVARRRSERDRRVVLVSLTERGEALVAEHRRQFEPRWRAAFAEFSDDELRRRGRGARPDARAVRRARRGASRRAAYAPAERDRRGGRCPCGRRARRSAIRVVTGLGELDARRAAGSACGTPPRR